MVANGDGTDPSTPENRYTPYRRAAVAGLMTGDGKVPGGQVDRGILHADPAAPFGLRLTRTAWSTRSEPPGARGRSCWSRAPISCAPISLRTSRPTNRPRRSAPHALRSTDRLVGRLLQDVGPTTTW